MLKHINMESDDIGIIKEGVKDPKTLARAYGSITGSVELVILEDFEKKIMKSGTCQEMGCATNIREKNLT